MQHRRCRTQHACAAAAMRHENTRTIRLSIVLPGSMTDNAAATTDGAASKTADAAAAAASAEPEKEEWEIQRDSHKQSADDAFRSRDYATAIAHYTSALSLDPTNHILLSNRSAAYLANGEKSKALSDARECIKANDAFTKGYSRLAAAVMSLGRWGEAKNAYGTVLKREPENAAARKGMEDCRTREVAANRAEMDRMKKQKEEKEAAEAAAKAKAKQEEEEAKKKAEEADAAASGGADDGGDGDLLDDFFADIEEAAPAKKKQQEQDQSNDDGKERNDDAKEDVEKEEAPKKIQIHLSDLGSSTDQIERLLAPNHEWKNLNPYSVLACPHDVPAELLSRRYKALSLLLHPDKCPDAKAKDAFEYVRRAMNTLTDEAKAKHTRDLIDQGMKQGKREYTGSDPTELAKVQERAVMKIFAEIERSRREVERRKRAQEQRERDQEDEEMRKLKAEAKFNKSWKEDDRVEKRIGNWRDFQGGGNKKRKI